MVTSLMIFHAVVSVFLIISVLLQFGKGAEAGLLGGSTESVFTGSQRGNILSKITTVLTIFFLGNCILLAKMQTGKKQKSILDSEAPIARPLNRDAAPEKASAAPKEVESTEKAETPSDGKETK